MRTTLPVVVRGCVSLLALGLISVWACATAAATPQPVGVNLSTAFNTDAIANPATPTKGGTSLDTKGGVI